MHRITFLWLLSMSVIIIGECYDLPGGESVSIVGENSIGTDLSQPVYKYPRGSFRIGDPSNYVVPTVKTKKDDHGSESSSEGGISGSEARHHLTFAMTSDVSGVGNFTIRSCLEGRDYKNNAYELMSAKYGNLTQSRILSYFKDSQAFENNSVITDYALMKIDLQESMKFFGQSYSGLSRFKNDKDFIQDAVRAGAISKTSLYESQSLNANIEDEGFKELLNNYTIYKLDTRFVGSSSLHAITDSAEIMQLYTGQIALKRDITSQLRTNNTTTENCCLLECCYSSPTVGSTLQDSF